MATPISFAHHFLRLLPFDESLNLLMIEATVDKLISSFWENPDSISFNASTIGLSAVMLGLSQHQVDCAKILCALQLHSPSQSIFIVDIDSCLESYSTHIARKTCNSSLDPREVNDSPVGVKDAVECADLEFALIKKRKIEEAQ
jgi:hypothetical protein